MQPQPPEGGSEDNVLINEETFPSIEAQYGRDLMAHLVQRHSDLNRQDRENIIQETWFAFWQGFQGKLVTTPWFLLLHCLRRRVIDFRRKRGGPTSPEFNDVSIDDVQEELLPWEGRSVLGSHLRNEEIVEIVERICEGLPRQIHSVIRKRLLEGLTFEQIAAQRGRSEKVNSLYRQFTRAFHRRLKQLKMDVGDILYE